MVRFRDVGRGAVGEGDGFGLVGKGRGLGRGEREEEGKANPESWGEIAGFAEAEVEFGCEDVEPVGLEGFG